MYKALTLTNTSASTCSGRNADWSLRTLHGSSTTASKASALNKRAASQKLIALCGELAVTKSDMP